MLGVLVASLLWGVVLLASLSLVSLRTGVSFGGIAISAMIAWNVVYLIGRLYGREGTIEDSTKFSVISSTINSAHIGVISTIPAFLIIGSDIPLISSVTVVLIGSILGVSSTMHLSEIVQKYPFPSGIGASTIIRGAGRAVMRAKYFFIGFLVSFLLTSALALTVHSEVIPPEIHLQKILLHGREWIPLTVSLSLMALGIGYLTGLLGLVTLVSGALFYLLAMPLGITKGWFPSEWILEGESAQYLFQREVAVHVGVGILLGSGVAGAILSLTYFREVSRKILSWLTSPLVYIPMFLSFLSIMIVSLRFSSAGASVLSSILVVILLAIALLSSSVTLGKTDWVPLYGYSILALALVFLITKEGIPAVLASALVASAIASSSLSLEIEKASSLSGVSTKKIRKSLFFSSIIGPILAIAFLVIIANWIGTSLAPAPQARGLASLMGLFSGTLTKDFLLGGFLVGAFMSSCGIPEIGLFSGLGGIIPMSIIIPIGIGSVLRIVIEDVLGLDWEVEKARPLFLGFIIGEGLAVFLGVTLLA